VNSVQVGWVSEWESTLRCWQNSASLSCVLLSDPRFDLPKEIPFPPGTSPFRQKGQVYLVNREYYDRNVHGGYAAILQKVTQPTVRTFFEQRFSASEWYDSIPNAYFQHAAANWQGLPLNQHGRKLSAWHAQSSMNTIYRALLRVLSTENVAVWAPRMSSIYYSFGKFTSRVVAPRHVSFVRSGVPGLLVPWIGAVMQGMAEEMLKMSGARRSQASFGEIRQDGSSSGQTLFTIEGSLRWD
jgi:hypothetical protein